MSSDLAVDRISNLPKNVIEAILMHLPIRDAVRTSILSHGWRYEWSTLPQLVFDRQSFSLPNNCSYLEYNSNHVKSVYQVLLLHRGPIYKFKLSTDLERCSDIDRWILFVSRNSIKELILDIWKGDLYKLPSCLFSCEDLTYLELFRCTLIPPDSFKGFKNLITLDLQHVSFPGNGLEMFLSNSPLLEKLVLRHIAGSTHLRIRALKLLDLTIEGSYEDLCLENSPLLATASINLLTFQDNQIAENEAVCNLIKVLGCLPSIEKLYLFDHTLQILAVADIPVRLPISCRLKHLTIDINFEDTQEMLAALCMFRSSPLLENLHVKAASDKKAARIFIEDFWEPQGDINCFFSCLQTVKVSKFTGIESELKFIKFVLAKAPLLETVRIELEEKVDDVPGILRKLIRFRRCSAKAEILLPE